MHEAYWELVGALVDDEDVARRDAEYAATRVMIERSKTIAQCVAEQQTDEARVLRKPKLP